MAGISADDVRSLLKEHNFEIVQEELLPKRAPSFAPVSPKLREPLRAYLEQNYPSGLYSHQSAGIDALLNGADVCLATSTASGKSLVFMSAAAQLCLDDPEARVLALYPAKALIQDQLGKWNSLLESLSLSVGYIDGSVATAERASILAANPVVLMTPDVAQAWLMSHLGEPEPARFLRRLKLLILDESHVYEGVFGTNMAYFLRRLQCVSPSFQIITSTATLANEAEFVRQLTGRDAVVFDEGSEGWGSPAKSLMLLRGKNFDSLVALLRTLNDDQKSRFLAFADSRKMVERLVAAARRSPVQGGTSQDDDGDAAPNAQTNDIPGAHRLFPYRAGYETEDRNSIQKALSRGELRGVVSTGALELGLDIGEIDLVVLLSVPRSVKAFRQRIGRAGRRNDAVAIIVDSRDVLTSRADGLSSYLQKPAEPNWLYLENRYIQYANALCAAAELAGSSQAVKEMPSLANLPQGFLDLLENELHPTAVVPDDLYPLKQRAIGGPHREFPIRSDMEQNFDIKGPHNQDMGEITLSQSLREAYPGAVYYYMARPYRVRAYKYRDGEIVVGTEKFLTTEPIRQTMVFPRLQGATEFLKSDRGFIAESQLQVSERVLGFNELRGSTREQHKYGVGSPWYQRELNRFFQTTGVCWSADHPQLVALPTAMAVLDAFSQEFGVHPRDLGVGAFYTQVSPISQGDCRGVCIYDATNGSLRLTQRLAQNFRDVVKVALADAEAREDAATATALADLEDFASGVQSFDLVGGPSLAASDDDWQIVIASDQTAMCGSGTGLKEVQVLRYRYTPQGLMYDLNPLEPGIDRYSAPARSVQPINGVTRLLRVNLITGEEQAL